VKHILHTTARHLREYLIKCLDFCTYMAPVIGTGNQAMHKSYL